MHSLVEVWGWSYCRICTRISGLHCVDHLSSLRLKHNLLLWWTWGFWANLSSNVSDLTVYGPELKPMKQLISCHFTTKQITSRLHSLPPSHLLVLFYKTSFQHLQSISQRAASVWQPAQNTQSTSEYQYSFTDLGQYQTKHYLKHQMQHHL